MSDSARPILAITMGDPAGVGPEVIVGAWQNQQIHDVARPVVFGRPELMRRAARLMNRRLKIFGLSSSSNLRSVDAGPGMMSCVKVCDDSVLDLPIGHSAAGGEAAYRAVRFAADLALERRIGGIVTAPLSKAALHAAG